MGNTTSGTIDELKETGQAMVREAARSPWVETAMRLGFGVRGVVYALMGILAAQVALAGRGQIADQEGAIAQIGLQPFGKLLLILIAVGLAGYAFWGFVQAAVDPMRRGKGMRSWISRFGAFVSAVSYTVLGFATVRQILGGPRADAGQGKEQAVRSILATDWGPYAIAVVGLVILVVGAVQMRNGLLARFPMKFDEYALDARQLSWAKRIGRIGTFARGLVFALTGVFLIRTGLFRQGEVAGMDSALRELSHQTYGWIALFVVALGLVAFGVYSVLGGLWFKFKKP